MKEEVSAHFTVPPMVVVTSVNRLTLAIDVLKETKLVHLVFHDIALYPVSCIPQTMSA